jgi:U3 small nucleolar RNA-associated protein 18
MDENALSSAVFGVDNTNNHQTLTPLSSASLSSFSLSSPAWSDPDDHSRLINLSESNRLRKLRKRPHEHTVNGQEFQSRLRAIYDDLHSNQLTEWAKHKWTQLSSSVSMTDRPAVLPSSALSLTPLRDANLVSPSNCVIRSCSWHSNSELFCTGGFDQRVKIFQVDGDKNSLVESLFMEEFPIHKCEFIREEILVTSRRKHFYCIDVSSGFVMKHTGLKGQNVKTLEKFISSDKYLAFLGNGGYIHIADSKTKQWIFNLKMNGEVRAAAFDQEEQKLWATGMDGNLVEFDMRSRECSNLVKDVGTVHGTAIHAGKRGGLVMTGNDSGVVNVYTPATNGWTPVKSLFNLTTPIDFVDLNSTNELALFASQRKRNAIRFLHIPTITVFQNFPTSNSPLGFISAVSFSPDSKYLTIGNQKGRVLLYRLNHY